MNSVLTYSFLHALNMYFYFTVACTQKAQLHALWIIFHSRQRSELAEPFNTSQKAFFNQLELSNLLFLVVVTAAVFF